MRGIGEKKQIDNATYTQSNLTKIDVENPELPLLLTEFKTSHCSKQT